jgi:enoyl-CoA hydratase
MDMCLTGRMMDAAEAERASLVSRVVPAADLIDEALKSAAVIASMGTMAAMMNKEMVNLTFETDLSQGLITERRLFQILVSTEDKKEGMAAFVEKRPANWQGR